MKLERYVIKPSLQILAVYTVRGNQKEEIANEFKKDEEGNEIKVIQTIDKLTITTKMINKYKLKNGLEINEKSELKMKVKLGQKLVYVEGKGFVIPERTICTVEEAIEDLSVLKED
jgi:hypothetical protein